MNTILNNMINTILIGIVAYVYVILILRITGKRTLSKFNAFDFIVTIALGSTLATILVSDSVSLWEGGAALTLLILLQLAITWLSVRFQPVLKFIKSQPTLLFFHGEFNHDAMKKSRVAQSELLAAMREHGAGSVGEVQAVVLETDGTLSVLQKASFGPGTTLENVQH